MYANEYQTPSKQLQHDYTWTDVCSPVQLAHFALGMIPTVYLAVLTMVTRIGYYILQLNIKYLIFMVNYSFKYLLITALYYLGQSYEREFNSSEFELFQIILNHSKPTWNFFWCGECVEWVFIPSYSTLIREKVFNFTPCKSAEI